MNSQDNNLNLFYEKAINAIENYTREFNDEVYKNNIICAYDILLQYSMLQVSMNDENFDAAEVDLINSILWRNEIDKVVFSLYEEGFKWFEYYSDDSGELEAAMAIVENEYLDVFKNTLKEFLLKNEKVINELKTSAKSIILRLAKSDGTYSANEIKKGCLILEIIDEISIKAEPTKVKEENVEDDCLKIKKCPNCGERLQPYDVVCPACKFQIRDYKSLYVDQIAEDLAHIDGQKNDSDEYIYSKKIEYIQSIKLPNNPSEFNGIYILVESLMDLDVKSVYEFNYYKLLYKKMAAFDKYFDSAFKDAPDFKSINNSFEKLKEKWEQVKSRRTKKKVIKFSICAVLILIVFLVVFIYVRKNVRSKTEMPDYTKSMGLLYSDIVEEYEELGFENINLIPIIEATNEMKNGEIVKIEFNTNKQIGSKIDKNTEINIYYFDKNKLILIPSKDYIHSNYKDVELELRNLGFTNINTYDEEKILDGFEKDECISISYEKLDNSSAYVLPETKINIVYYSINGKSKYPSENVIGLDYEDVYALFSNYGFLNIELKKIWIPEEAIERKVVDVEINGKNNIKSGKWFYSNDKVSIYYLDKKGDVKTPDISLKDATYYDIYNLLKEAGFSEISNQIQGEYGVYLDDYQKLSNVVSLTINGKNYEPNIYVNQYSKIIIIWEPKLAKIPSNLSNKNYPEVYALFKNAGFLNIKSTTSTLTTGWIHSENEVKTIKVDGTKSYKEGEYVPVLTLVEIEYYVNKQK